MEKYPGAEPQLKDSSLEADQWIGSPEHFEHAKNKAYTPTDWSSLEEWRQEKGPAPWDDSKWQAPPSDFELSTLDAATKALYGYTDEDTPAAPPQTVTRKQLDPAVSGLFAAAAFMAVQIAGIGDTPSNFVLENPAAATTLLASGAAAFGAATGYGINELNSAEKIRNAKHTKPNERSNQ